MKLSIRFQQFLQHAHSLHGNRYNYSKVVYVNAKTPITIICKLHGPFQQLPDDHIRRYNIVRHKNTGGCATCAQQSRKDTKRKALTNFIVDCRQVHGSKYNYDLVEYVNTHTKIAIVCPTHGQFQMTPSDHLNNQQGCRKCVVKGQYSSIAIQWLVTIEQQLGIKLRRVGSPEGEFRIPGTKFHVDGYNPSTNTIYEFYGDKYHGNPKLFDKKDCCHPYDKKLTAGSLYRKTKSRERLLKRLGYKLVVIWERDFRTQLRS